MLSNVVIVQNVCNNSSGRKSELFVSEAPADIPREDSDNLTSVYHDMFIECRNTEKSLSHIWHLTMFFVLFT